MFPALVSLRFGNLPLLSCPILRRSPPYMLTIHPSLSFITDLIDWGAGKVDLTRAYVPFYEVPSEPLLFLPLDPQSFDWEIQK